MKMSRDELEQAFRESFSREFSEIPATDIEINYTFSPQFEIKMNRLLRSQKRRGRCSKNSTMKKLLILAAILFALFTAAFAIPPISESVTGFLITHRSDHAKIGISGGRTEIEYECCFTEIPAGFALTARVSTPIIISKTYDNANGDRIILDQSIAVDGDTFFFDNENGTRWTQMVGTRGVLFCQYDDSLVAMWQEDGYLLKIYYYGEIDEAGISVLIETVQ